MQQAICSKPVVSSQASPLYDQRNLLDGSSIPTFVLDQQHTIRFWNKACEHVTGKPASEMINSRRQWSAFYHHERPVLADLIVDNATDEEISRFYGTTWRHSPIIPGALESEDFYPDLGTDGVWLFFSASPLLDVNGDIIGAIETLQDISERKRVEAALREHRQNLEIQVRQRTKELEQANEELSQYAFVVSHDLRAPLRAIRNYSGFLREEFYALATVEQRGYLDGIRKALSHGEALVSDILSFSRIGRETVTPAPIALDAFFEELLHELHLADNNVVTFSRPMPIVLGDNTIMGQIFSNLINNSLKFNQSGQPRVEISTRIIGNCTCEIAVCDNGIGIESRYQERIFKMFKRLHTHKEFEGTGIGLSIALKGATKLNGSVRVESAPGTGSTFYVTLPLAAGNQ